MDEDLWLEKRFWKEDGKPRISSTTWLLYTAEAMEHRAKITALVEEGKFEDIKKMGWGVSASEFFCDPDTLDIHLREKPVNG